jgi:hypothetical protein
MFVQCESLTSVPLLDTSSAETMEAMFMNCYNLLTYPQFNTSNVLTMDSMFANCNSLTDITLLNTGVVTNVESMFNHCESVSSNILAFYQQMSTQVNPPTNHANTFLNCGVNNPTGTAELAQIPTSWGGTDQGGLN